MYIVYYTLKTVNKSKPRLKPSYREHQMVIKTEEDAETALRNLSNMEPKQYPSPLNYLLETTFFSGGYAKIIKNIRPTF